MKNIPMVAAGWMGLILFARLSDACHLKGSGPFTRDFSISLDAVFW